MTGTEREPGRWETHTHTYTQNVLSIYVHMYINNYVLTQKSPIQSPMFLIQPVHILL